MSVVASQITSLMIVYLIVYSDSDQRKHQSSALLAFVWGIHRWPVNSPHKWPVTRKMFPFDDVIMCSVCDSNKLYFDNKGTNTGVDLPTSLEYSLFNGCNMRCIRCVIWLLGYYIVTLESSWRLQIDWWGYLLPCWRRSLSTCLTCPYLFGETGRSSCFATQITSDTEVWLLC